MFIVLIMAIVVGNYYLLSKTSKSVDELHDAKRELVDAKNRISVLENRERRLEFELKRERELKEVYKEICDKNKLIIADPDMPFDEWDERMQNGATIVFD